MTDARLEWVVVKSESSVNIDERPPQWRKMDRIQPDNFHVNPNIFDKGINLNRKDNITSGDVRTTGREFDVGHGSPDEWSPKIVVDRKIISITVEKFDVGDMRDAVRDPRYTIAPLMPVSLISPKTICAKGASPIADSWGVDAVGATGTRYTGNGVVVAILDTGIDPHHPAFSGVMLKRENFTDESDDDENGHGTHCAGTIFGRDVNGLRMGIARGVQRALIGKVLSARGGDTANVVKAINWAQSLGADVISISLGMDFTKYQEDLLKKGIPIRQATALALEGYRLNILMFAKLAASIGGQPGIVNGVLSVAAAGNSSEAPNFTIPAEPPANSDGFLSVAALIPKTASGWKLAAFSNVGSHLAAPGIDIWSAAPGGGWGKMSGTSMATPHVAGVACLWMEALRARNPNTDAKDVIEVLRKSAIDLQPGVPKGDVLWGGCIAPSGDVA